MSENALKRIKSAAPQKFCALPPRAPLLSSNMKITGCNLSKLGMQPAHPATPHPRPLSISRRVTPPLPKSCSVTPKVGDSYRLSRLKEPIQAPLSVRQSFDQSKLTPATPPLPVLPPLSLSTATCELHLGSLSVIFGIFCLVSTKHACLRRAFTLGGLCSLNPC